MNLDKHVPTSILQSGKQEDLEKQPTRVQEAWTTIGPMGDISDYFPTFIFNFVENTFLKNLTEPWKLIVQDYCVSTVFEVEIMN